MVSSFHQENKEERDEEENTKIVEKMFKGCESQHLRVQLLLSRAILMQGRKGTFENFNTKANFIDIFFHFLYNIIFSITGTLLRENTFRVSC